MPFFTIYDVETGKILNSGEAGSIEQIAIQSHANTEIVLDQKADFATQYVDQHEILDRPKLTEQSRYEIDADDLDSVLITEIPEGTVVYKDDDEIIIDDGEFEFSTALAGRFDFLLIPPFPYQELRLEIIANEV